MNTNQERVGGPRAIGMVRHGRRSQHMEVHTKWHTRGIARLAPTLLVVA